MTVRDVFLRAGALVAAGVVGAGVALGGNELLEEEPAETVQTPLAAPPATEARVARSNGLTINEIYERAKSGVVQINTSSVVVTRVPDPFFGFGIPQEQRRRGLGSGFVFDKSGHIVTNYHVVADVARGRGEISVSFSNRERVRARIVGVDPATDVAVLKVETKSRALTPLPLADSDEIRVGDPVVAIGNPFGLERTVTAGIVSALQRQIASPSATRDPIDHVIQTDAQINEGNSGGPLLNGNGEVIGVNTAIVTGNALERGNVGIGFAVPINTVREVAAELIDDGKVERPFLGVSVQEIREELADVVRLPVERGLLVRRVIRGSAADRAGLRAGTTRVIVDGEGFVVGGDIIVAVDGDAVRTSSDLREAIAAKKPGETIELEIYRGGDRRTLDVELGRRTGSG